MLGRHAIQNGRDDAPLDDKTFLDLVSPKEEECKEKLLLAGFASEHADALAKIFGSAVNFSRLQYLILRADVENLENKLFDPAML